MFKRKCTSCGMPIMKSGVYDPYLCRDCESENPSIEERYWHLNTTGN